MRRALGFQAGFTLIELMAGFILLSGSLLLCLGIQRNLTDSTVRMKERLRIHAIANEIHAAYAIDDEKRPKAGKLPRPNEAFAFEVQFESLPYPGVSERIVTLWRVAEESLPKDQRKVWKVSQVVKAGS